MLSPLATIIICKSLLSVRSKAESSPLLQIGDGTLKIPSAGALIMNYFMTRRVTGYVLAAACVFSPLALLAQQRPPTTWDYCMEAPAPDPGVRKVYRVNGHVQQKERPL